mmetsp:Transcript_17351/g.40047  ORF Transcript_17351/g.40047 Transcript_17351/m.40047 type:complete len:462 (+) Transcript_17351:619-2004(+)
MRHNDAGDKDGHDPRQAEGGSEEVGHVRQDEHQGNLNGRRAELAEAEVLEGQRGEERSGHADDDRGDEGEDKLHGKVRERVVLLVDVVVGEDGLKEDNGHRVIEDRLAKGKHVERRVHLERLEDGKGGDRVRGGQQRPVHDAVEEGQLVDHLELPEVEDAEADDHGGDDCAEDGKDENGRDVCEEGDLLEAVARLEHDHGEEKEEDAVGPDDDEVPLVHPHAPDEDSDDGANDDGRDGVWEVLEAAEVDHVDEDGAHPDKREREHDPPRLVVQLLGLVRAVEPRVSGLACAYPRAHVAHAVGVRAVVGAQHLGARVPPVPGVAVARAVERVAPPPPRAVLWAELRGAKVTCEARLARARSGQVLVVARPVPRAVAGAELGLARARDGEAGAALAEEGRHARLVIDCLFAVLRGVGKVYEGSLHERLEVLFGFKVFPGCLARGGGSDALGAEGESVHQPKDC